MKAVGYHVPLPIDDENSLLDLELPVPELRPRDLLVRVQAISVNPADVKLRASAAPPEGTARILGYDAVGIVEAVGAEATLFRPGDAVFYAGSIDRPGTYAELHAVDERIVGHKPASLGIAEAAALPLTAITAWELLFDRLGVPYGEKTSEGALLIVNGAGGVGSILIQLARRLTGLTVIATASRPDTIAWCRRMGAHHVIDHHQPLDEGIRALGIPEVQYVASLTATDRHLPAIARALAPQGALALIDDPATLDIVPLKRKSLSVHWELMFTRPLYGTPDMIRQHRLLNEVSALVDAGLLRTTLREDLGPINAANLRRAHRILESGASIGKLVLFGF
ncbi:zinc-binding alcohol dehydrogenase family protein [Roseomonas sp. NAR14]|uniref:Zinc-type alcohol dehydrogenase-like protein n=1 Tax=Roseomonas acroporae TaxID=2937791 RepID=A0A9X1YEY8_9PROT|nr:zinc-binding alcohol dehydrogenase family protein [Roseomonas acroporae]MCK8787733.1 zinc-binding alcohol dehydrogenase family protein [Roseomonas acroporae]